MSCIEGINFRNNRDDFFVLYYLINDSNDINDGWTVNEVDSFSPCLFVCNQFYSEALEVDTVAHGTHSIYATMTTTEKATSVDNK